MQDIRITLPSGKTVTQHYGTRVEDILAEPEFAGRKDSIIAAFVNNEIVSLSFMVKVSADIRPIYTESPAGNRVYRNTLCFLLNIAFRQVFPDKHLVIGHSMGMGYYYYFREDENIPADALGALDRKMRELISENLPINRGVLSYSDALQLFRKAGFEDTRSLVEFRNQGKIPVYTCGDFTDLYHRPLAPRTGLLSKFELLPYHSGLILRYPKALASGELNIPPFSDNKVLFSVYQEYKTWGKVLDINCVGKLNQIINSGQILNFIRVAEALHNKKIAEIADRIQERKRHVKIALIAGPSSSGKTTFTKKLAIQLKVIGFNPLMISLDDYFLPRELTPKDENGNYDFESLRAIDVKLLNQHLLDLFGSKETEIPVFDFKTGSRKPKGRKLRMSERNILLMEGIHGLNPDLTPLIPDEKKFRIYISALTQLNLDDHNRIPTTDNRLIRRIIRDYQFRGHSAVDTLRMWPSVRHGEDRNIFPYDVNADIAFNSALDYELSALKNIAETLLQTVKPYDEEYGEAVRLQGFLSNFLYIQEKHVPQESILREFLGDSGFKY
ncbi:MAG: nucleoside kinase [Spirochaetales bacterium]|nr:nucleoside kinase [Spirochaetales bacterium]